MPKVIGKVYTTRKKEKACKGMGIKCGCAKDALTSPWQPLLSTVQGNDVLNRDLACQGGKSLTTPCRSFFGYRAIHAPH